MVRAKGIEPSSKAWEAFVLPLYHARADRHENNILFCLESPGVLTHKFDFICLFIYRLYVIITLLNIFDTQKAENMTNNEIKDTLKQASRLVNSMDKEHIKSLLKVLVDAQFEKDCESFFYIDVKKTLKKLLSDLVKAEHVSTCLNRKQMKQIFEIMGDYGFQPICKLCGQPIEINSGNQKHKEQLKNMAFSWDHQVPKSKGGSYDLENLQPTHKICNNKRGTKPLYSKHYKIKMKINIDVTVSLDEQSPRYRPTGFGLRKQDSWCHKQCCQKQR